MKGEAIPKTKMNLVRNIKHPLDYIFQDSTITEEARKVTIEDVIPWEQLKEP